MSRKLISVLLLSLFFTAIFYHEEPGINLFLFNAGILALSFRRLIQSGFMGRLITGGAALTAIFVVIHASAFCITMNILSLFLLGGVLILPAARSVLTLALLSAAQVFSAPGTAVSHFFSGEKRRNKPQIILQVIFYTAIPLILVFFFLLLYQGSNPILNKWVANFTSGFVRVLEQWLKNLNFDLIGIFLLGTWVAVFFVVRGKTWLLEKYDQELPDTLEFPGGGADQTAGRSSMYYRSVVFLLILLNVLLLLQNILDIRWIWFGFEWNGEYLREFVHGGTYLLILSLLLSGAILLLIFRNPLPDGSLCRFVRVLSYAWLAQNLVLSLSVGFRVYWYIHYFALAYLRIGVILFLLMTVIALVTIIFKIRDNRSLFYLHRINLVAIFTVLIFASIVNWDTLIARYNFSHYRQSFVHLDWLSTLSDKSLPDLDVSPAFLREVRQCQDKQFAFETGYMPAETYLELISKRKILFREKMEKRGWLSWNLADALAFKKIENNQSKFSLAPGN